MLSIATLVLSALLSVWCSEDLSFPSGFQFGAATAAYQVEGAWNVSDKGESIWDRFTHRVPSPIKDGSTGDVACDSYHQYKRDVQIASELGLHFYRFSISWSRLLPSGFSNHISEDGKNYYNNLINELLANGIEPIVTMYHWDLPQILQELGGWTNPLITDWFADYARVLYSLYADRVKTWITINEPLMICDASYNLGVLAPGVVLRDHAMYVCNKHIVIAHAKAWRIYDEDFKPKFNGKVSITNQLVWFEADTPEDEELAELAREYGVGRFSHPIFSKEGGWPPQVEKIIAEKSIKQGYATSRLPAFTEEEIKLVRGTYDFYGMNHYTSRVVRKPREDDLVVVWPVYGLPEFNLALSGRPQWKTTASTWFMVNPEGIRKQLVWLKKYYGDIEILITENGYSSENVSIEDDERVEYYRDYLKEVLLAIKEDGVNVTGYTAWTLIDNFEWMDGYRAQFGLYQVDFNDPERKRTARKSARYYADIIKTHSLDVPLQNNKDEL